MSVSGPTATELFRARLDQFVAAGNTVTGRRPKVDGYAKLWFVGSGHRLHFGKGAVLKDVEISMRAGPATLRFGARVRVIGYFRLDAGSLITIGPETRFNRRCEFVAWEGSKITVGRDCLFSNVMLRTSDMHSVLDGEGQRINPARSIRIDDHVWISESVSIQKGVRIGENSIIAANAVVTKSLRPGTLAAGIPAVPIRTGISWSAELVPMPARGPRPWPRKTVWERAIAKAKRLLRLR